MGDSRLLPHLRREMRWRSPVSQCGLVVLMTTLSACGADLPDYRYKMTIHVATPAGEKTYSSVREIHSEYVSSMMSSSGKTIKDTVTGEAVVMDLPDGRTVYALLSRPDDPDYAKYVTGPALGPHLPKAAAHANDDLSTKPGAFVDEIVAKRRAMLALKGAYDLPRTVTHNPSHRTDYTPKQMWPLFVTFGDDKRPATMRQITAEEIGVNNVTVEISEEPVTTRISKYLPWLIEYKSGNKSINGDTGNVVSSNSLSEIFGVGAFMQDSAK